MTASCGELSRSPSSVRFLEQTVEDRPRVRGILRHRNRRRNDAGSVAIGGRGIAGYGDARLKESAIVSRVFRRYAHRHRLQTLEARGRFEVRALLAAMQRNPALGTIPAPVNVGRKRGRAVVASRRGDGLHHARQARAGYINRRLGTLRTRTFITPAISGILAAGVHIAALPVLAFAFHK